MYAAAFWEHAGDDDLGDYRQVPVDDEGEGEHAIAMEDLRGSGTGSKQRHKHASLCDAP